MYPDVVTDVDEQIFYCISVHVKFSRSNFWRQAVRVLARWAGTVFLIHHVRLLLSVWHKFGGVLFVKIGNS